MMLKTAMMMPPLDAGCRFLRRIAGTDALNARDKLNDRCQRYNNGTGIEQAGTFASLHERRQGADAENGDDARDDTDDAADNHENGSDLQKF